MKRALIAAIAQRIRYDPSFRKKLKFLALFSVFFVLLLGGGVVYVGIQGIRYLSNEVSKVELSKVAPALKEELNNSPLSVDESCWATAKNVLNFNSILKTPASDTIRALKEACSNSAPSPKPDDGQSLVI